MDPTPHLPKDLLRLLKHDTAAAPTGLITLYRAFSLCEQAAVPFRFNLCSNACNTLWDEQV